MAGKKKNSPKSTPKSAPSPPASKPRPSKGLQLNLSTKVKEEIAGLLLMASSVLLLLAIVSHRAEEQPGTIMEMWRADKLGNMLGIVGAYLSYFVASFTFGYATVAFPILFLVYGWLIFTHRSIFLVNAFAFYILTLMILVSGWAAIPSTIGGQPIWNYSGLIGGILALTLHQYLGGFGSATVWTIVSLVWVIMVTRISIADLIPSLHTIFVAGFRRTTDVVGRFKQRQEALLHQETEREPLVPRYAQEIPADARRDESTPVDAVANAVVGDGGKQVNTRQEADLGQKDLAVTRKEEPKEEPAVEPKKETASTEISFDTALIKDMKSLGRIDKQFVAPEIKIPDTGEANTEQGTEEVELKPVMHADAGEDGLSNMDLSNVDFKDVAKNLFEREHADLDVKKESTLTVEPTGRLAAADSTEGRQSGMVPVAPLETPEEDVPVKTSLAAALSMDDIPEGKPFEKAAAKTTSDNEEEKAVRKPRDYDKENQIARNKYKVPSLDILDPTQEQERLTEADIRELDDKISQIISTLAQFGINTKVVSTEYGGPVVAIYQLELPSGLKISRITGLEDELALSMKVKSVRMVPVTAKGTIQVEIPKPRASAVLIRSIFEDRAFKSSKQKYRLGLALGKTIDGHIHIEDLAKMPHLLVAGTTGSGKSVGVNSMITSLLYQFDPSDVKFVMIDPKKVELALYRNLKNHHLICLCNQHGEIIEDVITKPENAKLMLKALVEEMEERYEKLAHANVRNIEDYNKRWADGRMPDDGKFEHFKLEYIVAIIDELADLMMTAPREIETSITRLAQMARAVGIHLVVATQRPSVDVLTGLIKANFPARIAYQVRSKIDSRTILDMGGAELLLGKGDMLYLPPGQMPIRIQNAFTSTRETEEIVSFISRTPVFPRKYFTVREEPREEVNGEAEAGAFDTLFNEALEIVVKHNQGSASLLQRRLSVGYARAARIIDQLEKAGVVSAQDGGKPRQVLITEDQVAMYRI